MTGRAHDDRININGRPPADVRYPTDLRSKLPYMLITANTANSLSKYKAEKQRSRSPIENSKNLSKFMFGKK